jgi:exodeoxyribonuclease V alpha subunit
MNSSYRKLGLTTALDEIATHKPGRFAALLAATRERVARLNLGPDAVHLAAEIAALEVGLDDEDRFAMVLIVLVSLAALLEGSTRFPAARPEGAVRLRRMLDALIGESGDARGRGAVEGRIARLLASPREQSIIGRSDDARTPLLLIDGWLYHQRIHAVEARLAGNLARLLRARAPEFARSRQVSAAIDEVAASAAIIDGQAVQLTSSQRDAIARALTCRLTTISGGPGSGKTSIVVAILRVLVRLGLGAEQIALAAPTGKAADRMREMISRSLAALANAGPADTALQSASIEPATIHRLLGYSPSRGTFRHHRNSPLAQRVVIVDEGSMLDLVMMERLVGALGPDAQLIILGDADQLPSVTAGAVFRDLVPSDDRGNHPMAANSMRLQGSHRTEPGGASGKRLRAVAEAINRGDTELLSAKNPAGDPLISDRTDTRRIEFDGIEFFACAADGFAKLLERWNAAAEFDRAMDLAAEPFTATDGRIASQDRERMGELFSTLARARILTVLRVGPSGAEGINARMHLQACLRAARAPWRARMIPGEPVIVLRNDYERRLFNGDQGVIVTLAAHGDSRSVLAAVFARDADFVCYRLEPLQDRMSLAYAITVHKAQGSEFERVVIVLPDRVQPAHPLPILTRELLYTAVTRARRSALIVGARELVAEAIANPVARDSGLAQALASTRGAAVN